MTSKVYYLEKEYNFLKIGEKDYLKILEELNSTLDYDEEIEYEIKIHHAETALHCIITEQYKSQMERKYLSQQFHRLNVQLESIQHESNKLSALRQLLHDELLSITHTLSKSQCILQKLLQISSINDSFHIWYSGPFATINSYRVGRTPTQQTEWVEINAGLGETAAVVAAIANKVKLSFKKYLIHPLGSFSKLSKVDDRRMIFELYSEGSFSLFPKRNFNSALVGLLLCIDELGEYVMHSDPTLQLPYKISGEGKINNNSIMYSSDEEQWTRALKYMLTDVKWIIAWSTKHLHYLS